MVKTKLTFDEELERRQILEQIGNELEAVRSLLYEMAKYYVPQTYDIENSTNKQLIKKLDKWRNANFATVRERWMDLAVALNKMIKYHGKSVELIGLNEDGALVLRDDTRYILAYGDEISI